MRKKQRFFFFLPCFILVLSSSLSLSGSPGLQSDHTIKSWIDKSIQHCATFTVPSTSSFREFRIRRLEQGTNARTGLTLQERGFNIENEATGKSVYRYFEKIGKGRTENPVTLDELCLPPGNYRMCVRGGTDAVCILEYSVSPDPCTKTGKTEITAKEKEYVWVEVCKISGDLPNRWCPLKVKRQFEKGKEPKKICTECKIVDPKEAKKAEDEATLLDKIDDLLDELVTLKDSLEEFDSDFKTLNTPEDIQRAQNTLNRLRSRLNRLKDKQREARYFAERKNIDISLAGAEDDWSRITLDLNWTDNRIDLLESDIDGLKQAFTQEGRRILNAVNDIIRQLNGIESSVADLERETDRINSLEILPAARERLGRLVQALNRVNDEMRRVDNMAKNLNIDLGALLGQDYENIAQKWNRCSGRLLQIQKKLENLENRFSGVEQKILNAVDIIFQQCSMIKQDLDIIRNNINSLNTLDKIRGVRERLNLSKADTDKVRGEVDQIKSIARQRGINLTALLGRRYGELEQKIQELNNNISAISRHLDMLEKSFEGRRTTTPAPPTPTPKTPPQTRGIHIPDNCVIEGEYELQGEGGDKAPFRFTVKNGTASFTNFTNIRNLRSNCSLGGSTIRCLLSWDSNRLEISFILLNNYRLGGTYGWRGQVKQLTGWWKISQLEDQPGSRRRTERTREEPSDRYQSRQREEDPGQDEAEVLAEYCRVWPRFLKEVTHRGCEVTVLSCGVKRGNLYYFRYKYRCKSGFQWNEYNPQPSSATLPQLRKLLKSMKQRLGIR